MSTYFSINASHSHSGPKGQALHCLFQLGWVLLGASGRSSAVRVLMCEIPAPWPGRARVGAACSPNIHAGALGISVCGDCHDLNETGCTMVFLSPH